MNYRTLAQMSATIRANLHRIPRMPVVGIPRSGLIAASIIATLKNVQLCTVNEALAMNPSAFLLVDDSMSGGETMDKTLRLFRQIDGASIPDVTTFTVYVKPNRPKPHIWLEEIPGPRVFEWNWAKHTSLRNALLDIDGVICDEDERITNWDDPDHVRKVRESASILHLPKYKVKCIATGRKETEREQTAAYLERHGIRYEHLYMSTKERGARRTKSLAARETGCKWIIESNQEQAAWLHATLGIPVLCTDANRMFSSPQFQG